MGENGLVTSSYRLALLTDPPTWCGRALSGRSLDLLAVLVGSQDARVSDGALIEALWPGDAPARPLRALHVVVSRLRAVVGEGVVERSGDGYRLELAEAEADVRDLSDRADRARACAAAGQWEQVLDLSDSLPRVPACADADNAVGAGATPVARLRERAARLTEELRRDRGLALEAAGEHEQAADLLREAAQRDGSDETVLAALMRAESWARSPAAALEIYEQYCRRLCELGAVPGPAMRVVHEAVLAAESPVRHGLEPEPEHFLGREADVTGVLKALSTHRLVTLTGPGGVGKTTLAQVVAARSRRPAVYVVALAEVSPGADLARVVLDAIGGSAVVNGDPHRDLAAALSQPGTVLVLDNCEHLAGEAADLIGPLLVACPDLRVLATSCRPVDLAAEHVHRLEPLDAMVSHSLLVVHDHGLPRFHMLVTVRDFALEQLSASGDEAEVRAALHRWVVDLCSQIRFPIDAGDFGDVRHPEARHYDRLFQQVSHDEAVILQQLDRLLAQADAHGSNHLPVELRDAICIIGAALMRLWSVTWSYERIADYGARLIGPAVQPAQDLRGNEAGLSVLALCVTLLGLLSHVPTQVRSFLPDSFDGEGAFSRVRRFLRAGDEQWPELIGDPDPWVAWAATRCLAAQQEDDGDPRASLRTIEALLGRLHGTDLAAIHLLELHLHRLQVLMSLGRYSQVVDACSRAQVLLDRVLPSWGEFFRTTLHLEGAYCAVYLDPRPETADRLLESLEPTDLPEIMRFIACSVRGELELARGNARTAALIQRVSLRYAGNWRSILGSGSQWELYILSMCLITDVELSPDDAVELDADAVRVRATSLLRDILSDPAPRQRDIPTIMAFVAAIGLSVVAAEDADPDRWAVGAELVATAPAVGTNQTCRLLSHDYLRSRTERFDARALAQAEERIRPLDRGELVAHVADLAGRLAGEVG